MWLGLRASVDWPGQCWEMMWSRVHFEPGVENLAIPCCHQPSYTVGSADGQQTRSHNRRHGGILLGFLTQLVSTDTRHYEKVRIHCPES